MKLHKIAWGILVCSGITMQAMELKKVADFALRPILRAVKRIPNCSGERGDRLELVREILDATEQESTAGPQESCVELDGITGRLPQNTLSSSSQEDVQDKNKGIEDECIITERGIAQLRRDIEMALNSTPPKKYEEAIRLARQAKEKSRRKSIELFTEIAFDPGQQSWVRRGARTSLISMLKPEDQQYSGLYDRIFYCEYGAAQDVKDRFETFQNLYEKYICGAPANLSDSTTMALARYHAAKALAELKQLHNDLCNQAEFDRIQEVLEKSRKTLINQGILSLEHDNSSYHESATQCSEQSCDDEQEIQS
ncbi:hypothetical protein KJZ61_01025 [Candidatus Dependentiae bacterium]|nr:hypothetical protein [Candidatus Dependentiae bacterium]